MATKAAKYSGDPGLARHGTPPDESVGVTSAEVIHLLHYLKVAVDDVRDQLKKKRKPLLTVEEVAEIVGRTPYTVRRWITEGRIEATRVHGSGPKGKLLIAHEQIDRLVAEGKGGGVHPAATK